MNVLIVGGAGYVGGAITDLLIKNIMCLFMIICFMKSSL